MTPQQKAAEQANERPWEVLDITEAQWNERQAKLAAITTGAEPAAERIRANASPARTRDSRARSLSPQPRR